jgi:hypothetical protein
MSQLGLFRLQATSRTSGEQLAHHSAAQYALKTGGNGRAQLADTRLSPAARS